MVIEKEVKDGVTIWRVDGFMTIAQMDELTREIEKLNTGVKLVLNLKEVSTMDSIGAASLINLHGKLSNRNGKVVLANANEKVFRFLKMAKLYEIFDYFSDEKTAVMSLS